MNFKATSKQKIAKAYLKRSRKLICFLLKAHHSMSNKWGIEQHPCWAGGFSETEGVVPQQCDVCDPFHNEAYWMPSLKEAG